MKKLSVFLCALLLVFGIATNSSASLFFEEFLGGSGADNRLDVLEGQRAIFRFDLTQEGHLFPFVNWADVIDGNLTPQTRVPGTERLPTTDEYSFDPTMYAVDSATLRLRIAGLDGGTEVDENIRLLLVGETTSNIILFNDTIDLVGNQLFSYTVDPSFLADGQLRTVALALADDSLVNDFRVKKANLTVHASAVPEPTTLLFLVSGLAGLAGFGRKKFFRK